MRLHLLLLVFHADARSLFCSREGHNCGCLGIVSYGGEEGSPAANLSSLGVTSCSWKTFKTKRKDRAICKCDGELLTAHNVNYYVRHPKGPGDDVSGVPVQPENFVDAWNSLPKTTEKLMSSKSVVRASSEVPARWSPSFAHYCASRRGLQPGRNASRVTIFYGLTLMGEPVENGFEIAKSQLLSLRLTGLLPEASIHVYVTHVRDTPATNEKADGSPEDKSSRVVIERLREILDAVSGGEYKLSAQFVNQFEFPALHGLWKYARDCDDDELLLYMHNKGVTHVTDAAGALKNTHGKGWFDATASGGYGPRTLMEMTAFRQFVGAWPYVSALFESYGSKVQHVLIGPSVKGISWYNFFWARPSYLRLHHPPLPPNEIESFDRHYYEYWLGKQYEEGNRRACETSFALGACTVGECPSFSSRDHPDAHLHRYFEVLRNEFSRREEESNDSTI